MIFFYSFRRNGTSEFGHLLRLEFGFVVGVAGLGEEGSKGLKGAPLRERKVEGKYDGVRED